MRATFTRRRGRAGRLRAALGRRSSVTRPARLPPDARRRAHRRHRRGAGARGRPSTTSTRARTGSSCASARACSRGSPTGRPARSSPRRRRRCPRRSAASATGTTATRGSATRASRSRRSTSAPARDEAEEFVSFMTSSAGGRASGGSLQIMYGIGGEHDLSERELPHLRGWRDSRPVRVGNGAWDQTQLDVYGELLNALYLYREQLGELHPEIQAFVADLADTAARRWRETDAGHVGDARRAAPPPLLEGAVLDRARPRREARARSSGEYAKVEEWAAERDAIRDGDPRARLEREAAGVRAVVRLRRARRRRAADADRRVPAGDRRAHALDHRGDRPRSHRGRPRPALPQRARASTPTASPARRARS